jgi:hypothetical protein
MIRPTADAAKTQIVFLNRWALDPANDRLSYPPCA